MGLEIRVLGAPTVDVDGAPLQVDTRKAVALLARLAVGEPRIARDVVAGMLWPDAPTDRARASLRRTLSALTSGLGGRWVQADRTDICLSGDDVRCDAVELRRAVASAAAHDHAAEQACTSCRDALGEAAATWRGEFMEGFALRDAPAFEDWLLLEAEALRRSAATAFERLTLQHAAVGAHDDALAVAHDWVALDPLHEQAHRAVMRVAAAAGRRDEATRQFHECVAALDRELGVAPLPATVELHRAILEGTVTEQVPLPAVPPAPSPPPVADSRPARAPLVERGEELDRLRSALEGGSTDAVLLAVEGEAGIGKTRLVEELVVDATEAGHRTLAVRCHPGEQGLAAAPLVDLLREAARLDADLRARLPADVVAEVGRLVPELAGPEGPAHDDLEQPGARPRFLEGIAHALSAAVAGPRRGVLVVEDLHWADPTTVEVLGWLVRRPADRGVALVTTWRTESVPHDHALRQLARDRARVHVHLDRLDADGVAALVEAIRPEVGGLASRLHEETEGIPFFVVQYLMTWDGTSDWQLPTPVRDLVLTRLQPVSELGRQALAAAAVVGRAADVDTLVRVSGRSEDEVVEAVEELLALGLLREDARGYDCSHTKIGEVVHDTTSLARRRLLHRRAAEALLRTHRDDLGVAAPAARHLLAAGRDEQAAEQFARAATHARSVFANAEAAEHLESALGLGHPDPARLHAALGDLDVLAGRYPEARSRYDTATALAATDGVRAEVEHRMAELCLRRGDWPCADRHLRQTLDLLADDDVATRARVTADLALVALRRGEVGDADEQVASVLALADTLDDPGTLAESLNVAGLVARHRGDAPRARDLLTRAATVAAQLDDPAARVAALNNLALALADDDEHDRALAAATEALELSRTHGDRHREAALHSNVADLLHALRRTDEAMDHLKASARLLADVDEPGDPEPEIWKLRDW